MLTIRIISALLGVFMLPAPSCSQTCIGEFCFTKPSEMKNFEDSRSWCQANNSTLADINDTGIQMAVFLSQLNIDSQMFINMKLSRRNGNTWFLVNGTNYLGNVQNDNESAYYELYSYLKPHANAYASLNEFLVEASKPSVLRYNLCEFEGSRCLSNSTSNFLFNNRCYVKYDNESLTWFKARERCIDNGGDIAQFQKGLNPWIPPFNTDWMNISLSYWAGIRRSGWSWKYSGDNNEVMQTSWSAGEPNNVNFACVCVDPKDNPPWMWSDCDCATPRPFVCLQIVPTTTVITTTLATTTMTTRTPIPTTTASDPTGYTDINPARASGKELSKEQKIGLGVGIGGGVLIIIIVIIIVLAVVITRRKRKSNDNSESSPAVDDSGENDEEGLSNQATELNGKDLYSQVQKPPRNQINNSHGKDVYAQVNKPPQNQENNDVYAKVVPSAKQQTKKIEPSPEIIYSAPEFVHDPKSSITNSDYDVACRVNEPVHDMLSTPRAQIQSMFPIRYSNQHLNDEAAD